MQHFTQFLVGYAILAVVTCAPVYNSNLDRNARTLVDRKTISSDGNYYYRYYVDNGITQEVKGTLKEINGVQFYSVTGSYSYRLDNGKNLMVKYIADENGFQILSLKEEYPTFADPEAEADPIIDPKAIASLLAAPPIINNIKTSHTHTNPRKVKNFGH